MLTFNIMTFLKQPDYFHSKEIAHASKKDIEMYRYISIYRSMIKTWKLTYFGAKIYWIAKKIVLKIKKDRSMFSSRFYIPDVIVRLRISHDQTNRTNKVLKINAISLEILLDPTYRYFCWFYIEYILYWPVWSIYQ